ncbi:Erythropoietin [Plecturocebus cupreus]
MGAEVEVRIAGKRTALDMLSGLIGLMILPERPSTLSQVPGKSVAEFRPPGLARWLMPGIPALWEAEVSGSRECPAWLWLLLSLLWLSLGLPVLGAPLHLICDSGVLERYVLEGKEAENVTMSCAESCSLSENITVPDTKVNFYAWKKMEFGQQAVDVWQGLTLLSEAVLRGQALLANSSQPREPLQLHMDRAVSGLRSLTTLLRALGAQKEATSPPDAAPSAVPLQTVTADTFSKLFQVYSNFIRGKLKLYAGEACRTGDR